MKRRALAKVQPALAFAAAHLDTDVSLDTLADQAGLSPAHWHRHFSAVAGETPKQLTQRLRLSRAAAQLLATEQTVLEIAFACGFSSHEVFTRAFRRSFDMTPNEYRARGFASPATPKQTSEHAALVDRIGLCVGLYGINEDGTRIIERNNEMPYTITKQELSPQPVVAVRKRVKRSEIAAAIGGGLPHVFVFAQQKGIALTGLPLTRYPEIGPGMVTLEPSMRVAAAGDSVQAIDPAWTKTTTEGEVFVDTLPGGPAAVTLHVGPYDTLTEAYAALEQWIEEQGLKPAGAPWESYLTDPGEVPDPKDWKTEVFWPVR